MEGGAILMFLFLVKISRPTLPHLRGPHSYFQVFLFLVIDCSSLKFPALRRNGMMSILTSKGPLAPV